MWLPDGSVVDNTAGSVNTRNLVFRISKMPLSSIPTSDTADGESDTSGRSRSCRCSDSRLMSVRNLRYYPPHLPTHLSPNFYGRSFFFFSSFSQTLPMIIFLDFSPNGQNFARMNTGEVEEVWTFSVLCQGHTGSLVAFSSLAKTPGKRLTIHCQPALFFFLLFFFSKWESARPHNSTF